MKLVLDKKHGNRIEFIAGGFTSSFANMLRRYAISQVPVLAMETVTFYDNTSAFWDEYIAHRLGLMPITTPANLPESTEVIFSLDAEGPKTIYASDMKSSDKDISVAKDKIVVVTLGPDQHLRLEGKAVLGTAVSHSKYQAGLISYGEDGNDFRFIVESFYHMEPSDVLGRTCDIILSNIEDIEAALGKKKPKKAAAKKPAAKKTTKKAAKKTTKKAAKKTTKKK